jgi:hypothetical protein
MAANLMRTLPSASNAIGAPWRRDVRSLVQRSHLSLDQRDRLRLSARERRAHLSRLPELYWGHTGYRGYPAFFRLSDWGLSWDAAGALGDRRWGRNYHVTFAWVFLSTASSTSVESLHDAFSRADAAGRDELTVARADGLRDHSASATSGVRHAPEGLVSV